MKILSNILFKEKSILKISMLRMDNKDNRNGASLSINGITIHSNISEIQGTRHKL